MNTEIQLPERNPYGGFMRKYVAMRKTQTEYYRLRTRELLQLAKNQEKELDDFAERFFERYPNERPQLAAQTKIL